MAVRPFLRRAAEAIVLLLALRVIGLPDPRMPEPTTDPSYQLALNWAFSHGLQFGRDIIFTFGPLGFLHVPRFDPSLQQLRVLFGLGFALVVALDLVALGRRLGTRGWMVPAVAPILFLCFEEPDARLFITCGLFTLLALGDVKAGPRGLLLANLALLAVIGLIKLTFLLLGGGLVLLAAVRELIEGRRRAAVTLPAVYVAAVVALWTLAGQAIAALPAFILGGMTIVATYTAAMALPGPMEEPLTFVLAAAILGVAVGLLEVRAAPVRALLHLAGLGAVLFLTFKNGFTRHMYHRETATVGLIGMTLLYAAALWPRAGWRTRGLLFLALAAALRCMLLTPQGAAYTRLLTAAGLRARYGANGWRLRELATNWAESRARWEEANRRLARAHAVPEGAGTIDVLSMGQFALLAHDVSWRPRPIFQPYQATSSYLQDLNAEALRLHGADTLLADIWSIDERFPMLDQGRSLLAILEQYDVEREPGEYLVLRRRMVPRALRLEPIATETVRRGQRLSIGRGGAVAVWATIDVRPSLLGRFAGFVFRLPPVYLDVELTSGDVGRYRLVPEMARSGFLLSPLVHEPNALADLMTAGRAERLSSFAVRSITVRIDKRLRHYFRKQVLVELSGIAFERGAAPAAFDPVSTSLLDRGTVAGVNDATWRTEGDVVHLDASGDDPFVVLPFVAPSPAGHRRTLVVDVDVPHDDTVTIFRRAPDENFDWDRAVRFQVARGHHRVSVPLGYDDVPVQVRVDPGTRAGAYAMRVAVADADGAAGEVVAAFADSASPAPAPAAITRGAAAR